MARAGPGSRGRVAKSGMASAIPQQQLAEIVREARARTGVPAVAAGLLVGERVELAADGPVEVETPFRIASITKWFTASLAALLLDLDAPLENGASARRLLSHTADLRPSSRALLPEACRGLWSYSNAGYVLAGEACAAAASSSFSDAVQQLLLDPLELDADGLRGTAGRGPRARPGGSDGSAARPRGRVPGAAARGRRALVDRGRPASVRGAPARRPGAAVRCPACDGAGAASRRPSAPATASAVGAERSPAAAPRSTTRDRWAATSRFS